VYGNSYGTLKAEVLGKLRRGKDVLLAVDVQGAASIRAAAQQDAELEEALVTVFLTPPTLKVLEERLRKRNQDSKDSIRRRLAVSRQEIAQWRNFDYLILSSSIAEDIRRMQAIYDAERMRRTRVKPLRIQPE
jgi:guanylate kinase